MARTASAARFGEVDALRCLAMLSVIALHAHLFPVGWIGVWLFYVISGFVVTHTVLRRRDESGGRGSLIDFLRRRAARILPVYYGYLALGLLIALALGLNQRPQSIASLLFFYDNLTIVSGQGRIIGWPSGHLWTLSVEMQFYLCYGAALCFLSVRALRLLQIILILACPLARFAYGAWLAQAGWQPLDAAFAVYVAPILHFDIFCMGGLVALLERDGHLQRRARGLFGVGLIGLLAYVAVYCGMNLWGRGEAGVGIFRNVISGILFGEHREAFVYSAVGLLSAGLVALAAAGDPWLRPLLDRPMLRRIGEISYGGYVFHQLGLFGAGRMLAALHLPVRHGGALVHGLQFLIALAVTLALAFVSYRWFETPARRLIQNDVTPAPAPRVGTQALMENP